MMFFKPDDQLLKSIVEYANGRLIVEIGCGDCDVIIKLKEFGARVFGFEPFLLEENRLKVAKANINVFEEFAQSYSGILKKLGKNGLLLFARPCHSEFVEECIDITTNETESLYITIPENLILYDDLGKYEKIARKIQLKGSSEDNEIIMSIK